MGDTSLYADFGLALDPSRLLRAFGMLPDDWQERVLRERPHRGLLLCCRQAGKTLTAAAAALHEALYQSDSLILLVAPTQRQAAELFRKARALLSGLPTRIEIAADSTHALELSNGSRILSLPASEDTVRGFSSVALIVLDEAARVPDELYFSVLPMLAVSDGRLLALSTPDGQRGWFYNAWAGDNDWAKVKITAAECPRIRAEVLAEQRRLMTAAVYATEFECEFGDTINSVFSHDDLTAALDPTLSPLAEAGWT